MKVSGLNARDKMPMYEMPLIYVFGVWSWGEYFCIEVLGNGILSLAFFPRSYMNAMYFFLHSECRKIKAFHLKWHNST